MTDFLATVENLPLSAWLRESSSIRAYPTMLTLHTIGLALLVAPARHSTCPCSGGDRRWRSPTCGRSSGGCGWASG